VELLHQLKLPYFNVSDHIANVQGPCWQHGHQCHAKISVNIFSFLVSCSVIICWRSAHRIITLPEADCHSWLFVTPTFICPR